MKKGNTSYRQPREIPHIHFFKPT